MLIFTRNKGEQEKSPLTKSLPPNELQLPLQSVPIATKDVSSNPVHGEVYSIHHNVIKFVSDLRQVGDFLRVLQFPPPYKYCFFLDVVLTSGSDNF
jgi:hypothetical protein